MSEFTRRGFTAGITSLALLTSQRLHAGGSQEALDERVAIVDTAENAATRLTQLKAQNIRIVARYFARKPQRGLAEKRLAYNALNGVPEATLLCDNNISIISVYQYLSNRAQKFLAGYSDMGSAQAEAKADAQAALDQAKMVGQPEGTAIYFGVDYNLKKKNNRELDAVIKYFTLVKETINGKYRLGIYGNGYVNRILRGEGLVEYSWISASRSFEETATFFTYQKWHLFQNQVDRYWFGKPGTCPSGMGLDTDVQNPVYKDIGAWGADVISPGRTQAIFDSRRFATRSSPVRVKPNTTAAQISKTRCQLLEKTVGGKKKRVWTISPERSVKYANNVRIVGKSGDWVHVDIDDDGVADGYCQASDFTNNFSEMPVWRD